ncbi:MAG: undecaprenyl-diphosphate phosphatase [Firmicutes bacterium]|nr:undecaprenyl-diphosphate phosphatase [Bacillota bacterium]
MLGLVVLGLVQGLTEFLPVSSTAHLLFAEHYLGIARPGLVLEAVLHLGTAAAAAAMFWPDVARLGRTALALIGRPTGEGQAEDRRLLVAITVATAVTAGVGLLGEAWLEGLFGTGPRLVRATAGQLMITGLILLWTRERGARLATDVRWHEGIALGVAQAVAIIPGISRSGTTIVTGLLLGLRRAEAARFSFLMAIPAIVGAGIFSLKDLGQAAGLGLRPGALALGGLVAAVSGGLAIAWLLDIVRRGRLVWFSAYCWAVAAAVLLTVR